MESSHKIFCGFAPEAGAITESPDGFVPATLPGLPASFKLCGYMNAPTTDRGLNNSLGYSVGSAEAAYRKRGSRNPTISVALRGFGALSLLLNAIRGVNGVLPQLCFFVGVPGEWTDVYRFAKIGSIELSATESPQGEAAEITATLQIEAICGYTLSSPLNPNMSALRAELGAALFWHDVRVFTVQDSAGNALNLRRALSSISASLSHNLERKNERPFWGDDEPLSNTNYLLLEHNITASGSISLHSRLPAAYVDASSRALDWGDIVLTIGDLEQTQVLELTLKDVFPQTFQSEGVEAGAQLSWTVPFAAKGFDLAITEA